MPLQNDILQVVVRGTSVVALETVNVFHYLYIGTDEPDPDPLAALASQMTTIVLPAVAQILSTIVTLHTIEVINLFNPFELFAGPISVVGTAGGEGSAGFTCGSFRTDRVRRDVRRGFKRFGPVSEDVMNGNNFAPGVALAVTNIEEKLGTALDDNAEPGAFVPIIVKRIKEPNGVGGFTYRLPANQSESDFFYALVWEGTGITTQNSRK